MNHSTMLSLLVACSLGLTSTSCGRSDDDGTKGGAEDAGGSAGESAGGHESQQSGGSGNGGRAGGSGNGGQATGGLATGGGRCRRQARVRRNRRSERWQPQPRRNIVAGWRRGGRERCGKWWALGGGAGSPSGGHAESGAGGEQAGAGGDLGEGGSGVAGTAGDGHAGGGTAGQGEGGASRGGAVGVGGSACTIAPNCNWCHGTMLVDGDGCYAGYRCENGADPCTTSPCASDEDCGTGRTCGDDGLCWPEQTVCTELSRNDGFVLCDEGYIYRETVETCVSHLPRENYSCGGTSCSTDSDCAGVKNGFCAGDPRSMGACTCFEGCTTDADCDANMLCQCQGSAGVGTCVPTECRSDADCERGRRCASYRGLGCGIIEGFACQSAEDECTTDADCKGGGMACQLGEDGHRVCGECWYS